jgi:hypothetical protein
MFASPAEKTDAQLLAVALARNTPVDRDSDDIDVLLAEADAFMALIAGIDTKGLCMALMESLHLIKCCFHELAYYNDCSPDELFDMATQAIIDSAVR